VPASRTVPGGVFRSFEQIVTLTPMGFRTTVKARFDYELSPEFAKKVPDVALLERLVIDDLRAYSRNLKISASYSHSQYDPFMRGAIFAHSDGDGSPRYRTEPEMTFYLAWTFYHQLCSDARPPITWLSRMDAIRETRTHFQSKIS